MPSDAQPCMQCGHPVQPEHVQCQQCGFELGSGEAPEAWLGELIDHKYLIEEILGVGGMGMVFKARRQLIGDMVALKILFPKFLKSNLQRRLFEDEGISTAQLDHPNVIPVYDAFIDQQFGVAYLAMEYLSGFTFKEIMLAEAPMRPERLYPIFIQVCAGLSAAHQAGIIHRDLKPDNIFLTQAADGGFDVKILDFGIATMMGVVKEDENNKLLGTLRYMAPEQCRGEQASPQTDLYAVGVILYEALTRQRASGKSVESVLFDPIIPPSDRLSPDKAPSQRLEALIMQLLSKDPLQRPQSALAVKDSLAELHNPLGYLTNHQVNDQQTRQGRVTHQSDWEKTDHTPILEQSPLERGVSAMWYLLPLALLITLIYLMTRAL